MTSPKIIEALQRCELFNTLNEEDVKRIATLCQIDTYEAGDTVFTQGDFVTRIFFVAEGQVSLSRSVNLGERQGTLTIDFLGKGRVMGWSSLLCEPSGASASAVCQKPTEIISLEGASLRAMLEEKSEMGFRVMDRLAHAMRHRLSAAYGAMDTFR